MKNLKDLQSDFIDGVYKNNNKIFDVIKPAKASKQSLISIYQNNLFCVLTNALRITFKDVYEFLGEKKFNEIAHEFIKNHRSQSGNLDDYGADFPEFLEKVHGDFLRDLSFVNWLEQESYLKENEIIFDVEALQNIPQEKLFDLKFKLSCTCFFIESKYNLFGKKNREKPGKNSYFFVIFRQNNEIKVEKITKKEFQFLSGAKQGLTLFQIYDKFNCNIQNSLQKYIGNGVLIDFHTN